MAIEFSAPPPAAAEALATGVARVAASGEVAKVQPGISRGAVAMQGRIGAGKPAAALSLPVQFPDIAEIAAGKLNAAAPVGAWRHLLDHDGDGDVDADDATVAETVTMGGEHRFAAISGGDFPRSLSQTVAQLRTDPILSSRKLVATSMQVNQVGLRAVWLQAQDSGDDVIVPIAPAPDGLVAGRRYTRREIGPLLQAALKKREAMAGPGIDF